MAAKPRFAAQSKRARDIIKNKLELFGETNSLAKIAFAEGEYSDPSIWVDARSSPVQLLAAAPDGEPTFELKVPPGLIEDLNDDREDPQSSIFREATLGGAKGDMQVAIRFADLITPYPTVEPKKAAELNADELPKPTEDIETIKSDLRKWGYGLLKNALSPEQVAILKKAAQEQAAGERKLGVATFDGGPKKPNQRVWSLFNKGDEFLDLLNHPLIDEIVPWYLRCHDPLLWSYSINIARPGNKPQVLHWDQGIMGHGRVKPVALNISWLLCDFTEKNGATRIFPGSHAARIRPRNMFSPEGSIACEAPAGTAFLFESRLWHGTGQNTEASGERPCILSLFCHPMVRPKENAWLGMSWETEDQLPERQKSFFALRTAMAGVGGDAEEAREGVIVRRPRGDEHKPVGKVRASHDDAEVAKLLANGNHAQNEMTQIRDAGGLDVS